MTVSLVPAGIPGCGVNTAASPSRCHAPATAGDSRGSGADAGSGWLKVTVMLSAPSTPRLPAAGLTDSSRSGGGGGAGRAGGAAACCRGAGDPLWATAA
jgi:hypothetical protein